MNRASQELVGREVYSEDGHKVGKVKEIVSGEEYVIIGRFLFAKLVAPVRAMERSGDRLILPYAFMYLDMAPSVQAKRGLSARARARLDEFFMLKAP